MLNIDVNFEQFWSLFNDCQFVRSFNQREAQYIFDHIVAVQNNEATTIDWTEWFMNTHKVHKNDLHQYGHHYVITNLPNDFVLIIE